MYYKGGALLKTDKLTVQMPRERLSVPREEEEAEHNRMMDGSLTSEIKYSYRTIEFVYDYLPQDILEHVKEILKSETIEVTYYPQGSAEMATGIYSCTEPIQIGEIRDWDFSTPVPTPLWADVTFKLEAVYATDRI